MPIAHVHSVTKKVQRLELDNGNTIELRIEMQQVLIYHGENDIGRLSFSALSSLNNVEIRPLYHLDHYTFTQADFMQEKHAVLTVAVELFKTYTNGRIKIAKDIDADINLAQ